MRLPIPMRALVLWLSAAATGSGLAIVQQGWPSQRPAQWDEAWELFEHAKGLAKADPQRAEAFERACGAYETIAEDAEVQWGSEALMMAGLCRMWLDDPKGAVVRYQRALARRPPGGGTAVHIYLADAYLDLGRTEAARAQATRLLAQSGSRYVPEWQVRSARQILGQEATPTQKPELYDAAWALFEKGKGLPGGSPEQRAAFEESQRLYEQIAEENDGIWAANALTMAGLCRNWLGDPEGAVGFYEHALGDYPEVKTTAVHCYLAEAYLKLGRIADAQVQAQVLLEKANTIRVPRWQIASAKRILDTPPNADTLKLKHDAWDAFSQARSLRDPKTRAALMAQAETGYREYAKTQSGPERADALLMAGVCRSWMGDHEEAIAHYESALATAASPTRATLLAYMVMAYEELGDRDAVRATATQLQQLGETEALSDWQLESASLADADDELLNRRETIRAQMRRLLDDRDLSEREWDRQWDELKQQLSGLRP